MRLIDIAPCEHHGHAMVLFATEDGKLCQCRSCDIPTIDAVAVVRCKDCKYRSGLNGRPPYMFYICTCAEGLTGAVRENHFCSYGERRGEGE